MISLPILASFYIGRDAIERILLQENPQGFEHEVIGQASPQLREQIDSWCAQYVAGSPSLTVDVQVVDRALLHRAASSPGVDPDERRALAPFARRETLLEAGPRKQGAGPGPEYLPVNLPLQISDLSPFTIQVLQALREVPYGTTLTYGELAALAGSPGAARAAGTACRRNPFPLVIPCHRVIGHQGMGKYAYGTAMKKRLLLHEGALQPA